MDQSGQRKRAVVARTLACRRCGYNLRGTRVVGVCPECGTLVVETLERAVDPDAPILPELSNARAVGNALVGLLLVQFGLFVILTMPAAYREVLVLLEGSAWRIAGPPAPPLRAMIIACVLSVLGLWPAWVFLSPRGERPDQLVRSAAQRLMVGHVALAVLVAAGMWARGTWSGADRGVVISSAWVEFGVVVGLGIVAAVVTLSGIAGVLRATGHRSRTYRQSAGARQGIHAMNVAWGVLAFGSALALSERVFRFWWVGWAGLAGRFVIVSSLLMLLIGMLYLVVNGMWIRQGLLHPTGRISSLVRIEPETRGPERV